MFSLVFSKYLCKKKVSLSSLDDTRETKMQVFALYFFYIIVELPDLVHCPDFARFKKVGAKWVHFAFTLTRPKLKIGTF